MRIEQFSIEISRVTWDCFGFAFLRCVIGPENLIQSLDRELVKTSIEQNESGNQTEHFSLAEFHFS